MPPLSIRVLRVGHRFVRDDRTLTHLCLVSRALGAEGIYPEEAEAELVQRVRDANESWGGSFEVTVGTPCVGVVQAAGKEGSKVVHLTMHGLSRLHRAVAPIGFST